jgi:hypothetical protein
MQPLLTTFGDTEVPHWATQPEDTWDAFESFPVFLAKVWEQLGLPQPTQRQLAIARRLQDPYRGPEGGIEDIIRAFRGVGKSYITAAFVLWRLGRNPRDEKILVVSATTSKAKEFVAMVRTLLNTMPMLGFLIPGPDQTNQSDRFDVMGASVGQNRSLKAAGITGQITGGRTTLIVADDIEIPGNSRTEEARQRLMHYTSEFEALRIPGTDIIYLGTPQTEQSLYNRLVKERGYGSYCVPARFPEPGKRKGYRLRTDDGIEVDILAPDLLAEHEAGLIQPGDPTDPERFDKQVLASREAKGRSFFALQYQLDTSLSDAERYPLRQHDLIVFETNPTKAPRTIQWGKHSENRNVIGDVPNVGFSGDILLRPLFLDEEWREFESKVLFVDPSGRGKDETAWVVMGQLTGTLYCLHVGAISGDPATAMQMVARDAKRFKVNVVEIEPNMGGGMWTIAFKPILQKEWPGGCTVRDSEWAKGQKEARIIDTLEPVLTQHRLVIAESVVRKDVQNEDLVFSLLYQLTHITRDRGSLQHDDRLDALAGAVAHFAKTMGIDTEVAATEQAQQERDDFIAKWFSAEDAQTPTNPRLRGAMRDGKRGEVIRVEGGLEGLLIYEGDEDEDDDLFVPLRSRGHGWKWRM